MEEWQLIKNPICFLTLINTVIEFLCLVLIGFAYNSVCMWSREISTQVYVYIVMLIPLFQINCFYSNLCWFFPKVLETSLAFIFHAIAIGWQVFAALVLFSAITFCGLVHQYLLAAAVALSAIDAIIHLINISSIRKRLPPESYFAKKIR